MTSSELDSRNIAISMRKSVENLVISSQDAIGQSISQALTFSGVITHHNNQILHENRTISRSPSPSLRITDSAAEAIENDKDFSGGNLVENDLFQNCEIFMQAADTVSISSSELPAKLDNQKNPSNVSSKSSDGPGRTKKKSWYNSLYPTYKSKSDDFKRLFKELPDDERLIVDYSCALQKDILAHGRLYASQNYLCFHANIFGWETSLTLRWKEVTAITKEKTALVIPNAILVCTEGEKNFLTSFSGRDKAYLMLFRIWQNALMDQPITTHEIWQWVHSCYGEELGFASDDEEYSRDFAEDPPVLPTDPAAAEEVGDSCVDAGDPREEQRSSRPASHTRDSSPPLVGNGDGGFREEEGADTLPTDMSDTSDSELDNKNNGGEEDKCTNPHDGRLVMKQSFAFNIDQLFTMIFTNSKFSLELLAARTITDYVQSPWQAQKGVKCRRINYKLALTSGPIGPKEVLVTETQVMNKCSKPGVLYSIDCTSDNAGIPYAEHFSVCAHYCLRRVSDNSTELQLFGQVKYKKPMWGMMKTFLEKNSISGIDEFGRLLESRLNAEAEVVVPNARKARRHRRLAPSSTEPPPPPAVKSPPPPYARPPTARGAQWVAVTVILLLAINALLYWRLYHAGPSTFHMQELEEKLLEAAEHGGAGAWRRAVEQQAARAQRQLQAWRHSLHQATNLLQQTEQSLIKLLEAIKPTLEKAQEDSSSEKTEL